MIEQREVSQGGISIHPASPDHRKGVFCKGDAARLVACFHLLLDQAVEAVDQVMEHDEQVGILDQLPVFVREALDWHNPVIIERGKELLHTVQRRVQDSFPVRRLGVLRHLAVELQTFTTERVGRRCARCEVKQASIVG